MSYNQIIYNATMNDPGGPMFLPETTDCTPSSDDVLEFAIDEPPSTPVRVALRINAIMLLAFLLWLLALIF